MQSLAALIRPYPVAGKIGRSARPLILISPPALFRVAEFRVGQTPRVWFRDCWNHWMVQMILIPERGPGVSMSSFDGLNSVALKGCGMMVLTAVPRLHGHARHLRCQVAVADSAGQSAEALFVRVGGAAAQF
jgi:hypothetical protein